MHSMENNIIIDKLGHYPVWSDGKGLLPIANAYTNDAYA